MDGIAERLVDVAGGGRVQSDHLADGHEELPRFVWRTRAGPRCSYCEERQFALKFAFCSGEA